MHAEWVWWVGLVAAAAACSPGGFSKHIDCSSLISGLSKKRDTIGTICGSSKKKSWKAWHSLYTLIHLFVLGLTRKEIVLQRHTEELSEAEFLLSWCRLPATILPRWPAIGYFIACRVLLASLQVVCVPLRAYRTDLRERFRNFLGREKIAHHDVAFFLKYGQCAF